MYRLLESARDKMKDLDGMEIHRVPQLAIVVPNRNHGAFLAECLNSVINQTIPPDQVIFIDDCSEDNSFEIACKLLNGFSGAILHRLETHSGTINALNYGLQKVKSDYVLFLSSNDYLGPGIIAAVKNSIAKEHKNPGIWSAMVRIDNFAKRRKRMYPSAKISNKTQYFEPRQCISILDMLGNWFNGTTMFFNTNELKKMSGLDSRFGGLADLFAAMVLASKYGAIFSPYDHGVMRIHSDGFLSKTLYDVNSIFPGIVDAGVRQSPNLFTKAYVKKMRLRLEYAARINSRNSIISDRTKIMQVITININRLRACSDFIRLRSFDIVPFLQFRLLPALVAYLRNSLKNL